MFEKIKYKVIGVGLALPVVGSLVMSAHAAAPTTFDMSLATTTMDTSWDTFSSVVTTLIPYLLPIIASAAVFFMILRYGKRILFGASRG